MSRRNDKHLLLLGGGTAISLAPASALGQKRERAAPFVPNLKRVHTVLDDEVRQAST